MQATIGHPPRDRTLRQAQVKITCQNGNLE